MKSKYNIFIENLDKIKDMISEEKPLAYIARFLGVKVLTLQRWLQKNNIEYHGNPHRKGMPHYEQRISVLEYLGTNRYIDNKVLKRKLIEEHIKEAKCECCGLSVWMEHPIPLELHHKDENHYNNNLDNLEILCSNCHSLRHSYSQK